MIGTSDAKYLAQWSRTEDLEVMHALYITKFITQFFASAKTEDKQNELNII